MDNSTSTQNTVPPKRNIVVIMSETGWGSRLKTNEEIDEMPVRPWVFGCGDEVDDGTPRKCKWLYYPCCSNKKDPNDETKSDETTSDETKSDEIESDETKSDEIKSDEIKSDEIKCAETII